MSIRNEIDVLIVGGGRLGTALGTTIAKGGRHVMIWTRNKAVESEINEKHTNSTYLPGVSLSKNLRATGDLKKSIPQSQIILMSIPSQSFRDVARSVGDIIEGDQLIVHTTKGFEVSTFKRMSQILREETCALKIGVLSGPTIAREIVDGHPTGALIASHYNEVIQKVQALFEETFMRVYGGKDVVGTEVAGAFKNVIAVAAGVVDGLKFGNNAKWLLVTRGLVEMGRLGVAMGGNILTFGGLAGIADLAATCASPLSVSHQIGFRLAQGQATLDQILSELPNTAEAIPTTQAIKKNASSLGLELPIVNTVHGLLMEGWTVKQSLDYVMSIPVGDELAAFSQT